MLFIDVLLRTRKVLSLHKIYSVSALLVLSGTSLNNINALLAFSRRNIKKLYHFLLTDLSDLLIHQSSMLNLLITSGERITNYHFNLGINIFFTFQDFHLGRGGGGCKRLCACTHITSTEPNSLSAGVQGPPKGPGSSRVALMISHATEPYF